LNRVILVRNRTRVLQVAIAVVVVLGFLSDAFGVPLITNSLVYVDNRPLNDPFGHGGLTLHAELGVTDPSGTPARTGPGAASAATSNNPNFPFPQPFPLPLNLPAPIPGGADFINFLPITAADFPNIVGNYTLGVRNTALEVARITNVLLKPEILQLPTDIVASDDSTTPTITWTDPNPLVPGLGRTYQIQLIDDSLTIFFTGGISLTPSIAVPPGLMTPGREYLVRVNIFDVDLSQPSVPVPNPRVALARDYLAFTPVPEASSLVLLGIGLLLLSVLSRLSQGRKAIGNLKLKTLVATILLVAGPTTDSLASGAAIETPITDLKTLSGDWRSVGNVSPAAIHIKEDGTYQGVAATGSQTSGRIIVSGGRASYQSSTSQGTVIFSEEGGKDVLTFTPASRASAQKLERVK